LTNLYDSDPVSHQLVNQAILVLERNGPAEGRPLVDTITASRIANMKELRPPSAGRSEIRILLVFDPWRSVVLLVAGDKSGQWEKWYRTAIPRAEQLYEDYLAERRKGDGSMSSVSRWRDSGHLERAVETAGGQEAFDAAVAAMLEDARGWRLAEMRKRRGMTQEQVATRMGVSVARVSQIENGDVSTQDVLNRYVTALGGTLKLIADFGDEQLKIA
jgi:DNA-binding XRE family transcriptional regulator